MTKPVKNTKRMSEAAMFQQIRRAWKLDIKRLDTELGVARQIGDPMKRVEKIAFIESERSIRHRLLRQMIAEDRRHYLARVKDEREAQKECERKLKCSYD